MGFAGNSEANPVAMEPLTIADFCISLSNSQCNSNGYFLEITNRGQQPIVAGTIQLYFSDLTKGTSAEVSCQLTSPLNPQASVSCPNSGDSQLPAALNAAPGDAISLQVVTPDGSRGISSALVQSSPENYVPITIANSQTSPTPDDLQVSVNVDFDSYAFYLSPDVGNIRFYNSTTFTTISELPAWLENYTGGSGQSNVATSSDVWIKLAGTIVQASSQVTIYMVFDPETTDFDGVYWGEAPQLSPTFGEYDNGAQVFLYYNAAPQSLTGWTIVGTAGLTSAAVSGSYFHTEQAFYANSANGDYLYTQIPGLAANEVLTFWTYTTGLGNVYYLASSTGAGLMGRLDGRGGSDWSGLAATTSWTSWSAPGSGLDETKNKWYKYDIVIGATSVSSYIGSSTNNLGTLGTLANTLSVSNKGNYLGLVGDALGASYISYWNGIILRYLPPNGVAPSISFGTII
jgi:hypothetical protein